MHGSTLFATAILAVGALAAPLQADDLVAKGTFKVGVKGSRARALSPAAEMRKVFGKYGWLQRGFSPFGDLDPFDLPAFGNGIPDSAPSYGSGASAPFPMSNHTTTASFPGTGTATVGPTSSPTTFTTSATTTGTTTTNSPSSTGSGSGSAEVTTTPENNDSEYLTPVTVGGQTLNLDFDTGSADLWVFSSKLPANQRQGHTIYDSSKSSTYQALQGGTWKIQYGDGSSAQGVVGYDVVAVGAATATKQAVEQATTVASQFVGDTNNDGLLGLAFSTINTVEINGQASPQKTFFENIQGSLKQALFSVDLKEQTGTYEFGAIDDTAHTGQINYVSIDNSDGFWQFTSTKYTINGQAATNSNPSPAIADTGTSLLLTDDNVVEAYYAQVQGAQNDQSQGGYVYPCSATLPDFGVQIGDYTLNLKGSGLTYATVSEGSSQCFGGIQSNAGAGYQIFGDVMLRQAYAVFDGGNQRFGVAPKAT